MVICVHYFQSIDFELLAKKKMVTVDKPAESVKPIKCEIKSDVFSLTVQVSNKFVYRVIYSICIYPCLYS